MVMKDGKMTMAYPTFAELQNAAADFAKGDDDAKEFLVWWQLHVARPADYRAHVEMVGALRKWRSKRTGGLTTISEVEESMAQDMMDTQQQSDFLMNDVQPAPEEGNK